MAVTGRIRDIGSLKDLIWLLQVPIGTQKNIFEIYRQFGHATSKMLASLDLDPLVAQVLLFFVLYSRFLLISTLSYMFSTATKLNRLRF